MDDWDSLQDRLDELMDIRQDMEELEERMEALDVCRDDLDSAIAKCRHELHMIEEAEREEMRREYERSVL